MNALIILGLLVVLMLTGMPISISLGLTVLSFLFFIRVRVLVARRADAWVRRAASS